MTAQPIRVLHILCSKRFSGAENVVCQIIRMFENDERYEMVYCSPDGEIRHALEQRGVNYALVSAATPKNIRKIIKKVNPTVIHAHDMKASVLSALVCGSVPVISHIHGNSLAAGKRTLKAILYRLAAKKARHIFWVSEDALEGYCYKKDVEYKSSMLENVVDAERIISRADCAVVKDSFDVVYVGRLEYPKNPERIIGILDAVTSTDPSITAAVVGGGDMEMETRRLVEERGLGGRIRMMGFVDNPLGIMKNAKVMIMASLFEGMPMSALEATCLGLPIVCTPTDGLCKLVIDGKTGYLRENDEDIVEKTVQIIRDADERERLSREAKKRAEQFSDLASYRDVLDKEYMKCLKKGKDTEI